jgi:hypothetical protein
VSRQPAHQVAQPSVPGYAQGVGVKPPWQNERRSGASVHTARNHPAPGATPARDQPRDIPGLEIDQIDRQ